MPFLYINDITWTNRRKIHVVYPCCVPHTYIHKQRSIVLRLNNRKANLLQKGTIFGPRPLLQIEKKYEIWKFVKRCELFRPIVCFYRQRRIWNQSESESVAAAEIMKYLSFRVSANRMNWNRKLNNNEMEMDTKTKSK